MCKVTARSCLLLCTICVLRSANTIKYCTFIHHDIIITKTELQKYSQGIVQNEVLGLLTSNNIHTKFFILTGQDLLKFSC
jgi:hypothetical protein